MGIVGAGGETGTGLLGVIATTGTGSVDVVGTGSLGEAGATGTGLLGEVGAIGTGSLVIVGALGVAGTGLGFFGSFAIGVYFKFLALWEPDRTIWISRKGLLFISLFTNPISFSIPHASAI